MQAYSDRVDFKLFLKNGEHHASNGDPTGVQSLTYNDKGKMF